MHRSIFDEDHQAFRETARRFLHKEVVPHFAEWERRGVPDKGAYRKAAELGLVNLQVPEEYGGPGTDDFRFNAVFIEESALADCSLGSLRVHSEIALPYLLSYADTAQRERWLPAVAAGELFLAIAMTEPGTGSDLAGIATTAVREGDHYVLNGAKTFITGGRNADRILVVCRTSKPGGGDRRSGLSILVVDTSSPGFEVGRTLDKIGLKAQDTVELSFTDVRVPAADLLGEEGRAFEYLANNLAQERLTIAVSAQASAVRAVQLATAYAREREVFGRPLSGFQNTKFTLAECETDVAAGQALLDQALEAHSRGELTGAHAAKVKLFTTEMQHRVVDACLQLHGGYGYITEHPIARLYADARVTRIFSGTSEVMKSIIAKSLDL
ncbi:acyl-CoA dehydrogenase family protein [Nocardiopsis sp. HNM0947]|uniref:Acyl-[acyl-carrier-protein] dehydrogenase MbtN n=1 Tax=Nocardiopsis coralli TaxID=2772213 RepID=A0ABR9P351_9ACTN|nr:acyl-CoA dehydrogenase family protein [Nocardiopsis coralli]MBE2998281.1 acyl-CoA dehydrogenase family protein [Nocardiopsis coralli]